MTAKTRSTLSPGDKVTVTITGECKVADVRGYAMCVELMDGEGWQHFVYPDSPNVQIHVVKKNFTPKPGEVYRVGSSNWICVNNGFGTPATGMISQAGVTFSLDQFAREFPEAKKLVLA